MSAPPAKRARPSPAADNTATSASHILPTAEQLSTLTERECRALLLTLAQMHPVTARIILSRITSKKYDFSKHVVTMEVDLTPEREEECSDSCSDCGGRQCEREVELDFVVEDCQKAVNDMTYKSSQSERPDTREHAIATMIAMGREFIKAEERMQYYTSKGPKILIQGCKAVLEMMEARREDTTRLRADIQALWTALCEVDELVKDVEAEWEYDGSDEEADVGTAAPAAVSGGEGGQ